MVYRVPPAAPQSQVPPERRGMAMGRFCLVCASLYPEHRAAHRGQPVYGRDHIASPCTHEGDLFAPGAAWWEPAVEVLPAPAASAPASPAGTAAPPAPAGPGGSGSGAAGGGAGKAAAS
jgi:hypothetical protein